MILCSTAVNVSLAAGCSRASSTNSSRIQEAALVDGYTRLQRSKVVLPQAATGIAATAIFCLISSWNEYAFNLLSDELRRADDAAYIPFIIGEGGQNWPAVAAGTTLSAADHDSTIALRSIFARHRIRSGAPMTMKIEPAKNTSGHGNAVPPGPMETLRSSSSHSASSCCPAVLAVLYTYSFVTILTGVAMFVVVTKFPDRRGSWRRSGFNLCTVFGDFVAVKDSTSSSRTAILACSVRPAAARQPPCAWIAAWSCRPRSILPAGEDATLKRASARDIAFVFQLFALSAYECAAKHRLSVGIDGREARRGRRRVSRKPLAFCGSPNC